jgi:hypothetical protein
MLSPELLDFPTKKGKNRMRSLKSIAVAAFALLTFLSLASATPAHAQFPAYLHALSDLRSARAYLQFDTNPANAGARDVAINEINRAIDDIKRAARDDGKNPWHTPPPQSGGNPNWPIHSAKKLLKEARHDVESGQDQPENIGLQMRSIKHIDRALEALGSF